MSALYSKVANADSSESKRVTFAPPFKSSAKGSFESLKTSSPKQSPKGTELKDNLSLIYDKIAIYKCDNIPQELNIRTAREFSLLCDALYKSNHLNGYLVEDFICEDVEKNSFGYCIGILKLHITLGGMNVPSKLTERYTSLRQNKYILEDVDTMCLGECKFLRNINGSFCGYCERKYGRISKNRMKEMQETILNSMNRSRREEYRNIRSFLATPLPDFVLKTKYQDVTLSFKAVDAYDVQF